MVYVGLYVAAVLLPITVGYLKALWAFTVDTADEIWVPVSTNGM